MIIKFPNNFSFRGVQIENFKSKEDIVQYAYPLLSKIITIKSSTVIAEKIMQILLPTKGTFSMICDSFITFLLTTIQTLNTSPPLSYSLGIRRLIATNQGIPCVDFFKESSIVFWMKVDTVLASQISTRTSIFNTYIDDIEILELYIIQNILFLDLQHFYLNSEYISRTSEDSESIQFKLNT
ncbi:hypothetical protein TVAG_354580 [Trichomonas vaginalis G3]|uniref:Uncharacterized protein n=1 Tax=Trichomonas vaginalis (strain ATCC PRA-98 / G3) TaxID=412133 RepID=A2FMZ0_TRIV3|nr:platelet formation protein family [Trichomonas vaginalis G3]EAX93719.1 hypothetical protein TVAG_354580 [Trichomonas vaginalis G3]KAI5498730.1 platelet formation protein family [Trichomonas vaginalis G3]|eukprot:XP_001306649.1 hypothetical protein [Trichomonas vaginalis G3]